MKKEQSSISSILDIAFIAIGVALLIHSFFKFVTDLNSYTIGKIIDETIIGVIFICSRFLRNSLLGISFWVLISIGIVLYATKTFGSLGAFIALIFCITFPFWALGKYEDFQENNENSQEKPIKINYDRNADVTILSSEKIANEVNQVDDLHMQHVSELISVSNTPQNTANDFFLKPYQKKYDYSDLKWYRDNDGIHCDALQEFYPNDDFIDDGIDVEIRYRGTLYHIPINKIENYVEFKMQKNLF